MLTKLIEAGFKALDILEFSIDPTLDKTPALASTVLAFSVSNDKLLQNVVFNKRALTHLSTTTEPGP